MQVITLVLVKGKTEEDETNYTLKIFSGNNKNTYLKNISLRDEVIH